MSNAQITVHEVCISQDFLTICSLLAHLTLRGLIELSKHSCCFNVNFVSKTLFVLKIFPLFNLIVLVLVSTAIKKCVKFLSI